MKILIVCCVLILGVAAAEMTAGEPSPIPDYVVARGEGFQILRSDWDELVVEQKVGLQARGRTLTGEQERLVETQVLERMINQQLMLLRANEDDRTLARGEVEVVTRQRVSQAGGEDAYRRQLLAQGLSPEEMETRLFDQALAQQVLVREIRSKLEVSDAEIRAFYEDGTDAHAVPLIEMIGRFTEEDRTSFFYQEATNRLATMRTANLARLERPERARARVAAFFTVDTGTNRALSEELRREKRQKADECLARVRGGADFAELAAESSEEPDARVNQAEYVAVRDRVPMVPLRDALFGQPIGEVGEVVETEMGYYLVQVLERRPAGKAPLDEVRDSIEEILLNQKTDLKLAEWLKVLREEAKVEVNLP